MTKLNADRKPIPMNGSVTNMERKYSKAKLLN